MDENNKNTVIEDGTEFDGKIRSQRPITLSGTVKLEKQ